MKLNPDLSNCKSSAVIMLPALRRFFTGWDGERFAQADTFTAVYGGSLCFL